MMLVYLLLFFQLINTIYFFTLNGIMTFYKIVVELKKKKYLRLYDKRVFLKSGNVMLLHETNKTE
jgi:hypothetical protein